MRPEDRKVLEARCDAYEEAHPDIVVHRLYKETEELRSGLVSAVLAGRGPEVIYGPSDVLGLYQAMGALADMSPWFSAEDERAFDPRAIIRLPDRDDPNKSQLAFIGDRFGNHLALIYNRKYIPQPPKTTAELLKLAKENTVDEDGDGAPDRYGLVWNYTEPFFVIPFLTGYGAWVFKEPIDPARPATATLDSPEAVAAYRFVAASAASTRCCRGPPTTRWRRRCFAAARRR